MAAKFDGSGTVFKEPKEVYYDGGWKPEHTVHSLYDENAPPAHFKVTEYQVVRNDTQQYTWMITTSVTHPYDITKNAWRASAAECDVTIEGQQLVIVKKGEQFGVVLKLPKSVDLSGTILAEGEEQTLFVTIPKIGATQPPVLINAAVLLDAFGKGPDGTLAAGSKVFNHPSLQNSPELMIPA
uniref:Uncharacterized protein n=1 Tax=Haptolina ericina TaxID=156174 RepID=A0A7S3EVN1_9EUKA|mmetsp:Transcript_28413/g.64353  ORF Transcript_28413/g.64353 Transcript_28413/m.64353 type:complete len:183 (+) Transcript_28413:55-603(+)